MNPSPSAGVVHRLVPLAVATALGVSAGCLVGAYWTRGGPWILTAALVGILVTSAAPLVLWRQSVRLDARRARESAVRERRLRYEGHTEMLNDQAVRPLRSLHLDPAAAGISAAPAAPLGLVVSEGEQARPVEQLPNWSYAVEHLRSDPSLGPSWAATEDAVRRYYALRSGVEEELAGRYTHLLLSRYGFETRLEGHRFDPPPWFDARAFVGVALSVRGRLDRSTVTVVPAMVDDAADDDATAPHLVLIGDTPVACAPSRDAANPGEIADLVELGRSGAATTSTLRAVTAAQAQAAQAVAHLAEVTRHYSDRMVIEHAGAGACSICRPWFAEPAPPTDVGGAW